MRKRNVSSFFDILFWFLVYSLPVIAILLCVYNGSVISMSSLLSSLGIDCTSNIIYTTLVDLFGVDGVFPMFANNSIFEFASYFVLVNILHLIVDVLLFIPRICHDFMNKSFGGASL